MIDFLKNWAINIVIISIFVTFLEIILPNSEMKRYVKLIIGLLVIIVLINPFINLLNKDINIEKEVLAQMTDDKIHLLNSQNQYAQYQKEQIVRIYKDNLINNIKDLIKDKTDYAIENVIVDIEDKNSKESFGEIKKIYITFEIGSEKTKETTNIQNIEKVNIKVGNKTINDLSTEKLYNKDEIIEILSKSYGLSKDKIILQVNNN